MTVQAPAPQAPPAADRQVPPGQRPVTRLSVVATVFVMVAFVSLWVAAQLLHFGGLAHDRTQKLLFDEFRHQLAMTNAPLGPQVEVGAPVALLEIGKIGLQEVVVEGTASGDLLAGPGHMRNSPPPGQVGTAVVLAPRLDVRRSVPTPRLPQHEATTSPSRCPRASWTSP